MSYSRSIYGRGRGRITLRRDVIDRDAARTKQNRFDATQREPRRDAIQSRAGPSVDVLRA